MANTGDLRVSHRGQMSLPAAPRRRWGLHDCGDVAYLDLGDAMLLLLGRKADLRAEVLASITDANWENSSRGFGDLRLTTE